MVDSAVVVDCLLQIGDVLPFRLISSDCFWEIVTVSDLRNSLALFRNSLVATPSN